MDTDAGVQAILQQWQEVKTEQGTVERTFTQWAQAWPLANHVKLEGMESAIHILKQACDYLHEGMVKLSSITDQKCDTEKVRQAIAELMVTLQQLQTQSNEGSRRSEVLASRVDVISGEAANVRGRLEGLERRVGMESQQHESVLRELRASHDQHATDLSVLCHNANEYQADIQARDNETFELKELIFKLSVEVDEVREDAKKVRAMPEKGFVETADYQERMNVLQRNLDESRRQLEAQEQKIREGERRLSRLQEEVSVNQLRPKAERHEGLPDDIQAAIEDRFAKIEEKLQRNQRQSSQWQEDSVRDFQAVEACLGYIPW